MCEAVRQYYGCPDRYASFISTGLVSNLRSHFKFKHNDLYGRLCPGSTEESLAEGNCDEAAGVRLEGGHVELPFDPSEAVENLRLERYLSSADQHHPANSHLGKAYYLLRPLLPVKVRRHFQKIRLKKWHQRSFPHWPVDKTVENTMADLLLLSLQAHKVDRIPFIWFWPDGATSAALVTHDVETAYGRDLCETVMDIDDAFGIKGSFEVVPEKRYKVSAGYIDHIWNRGFEVAVHDLNHDGHLYSDHKTFRDRAVKINEYRKKFRAEGFRAAVLYRNQEWYDALNFSYDSSVPNVAHLDPQRGGCCTVMPYFIGDLVELPVTITQDYALFHILGDYSIDLWKRQIELITQSHGLINVIIHPDYSTTPRERVLFEHLLSHLAMLRQKEGVWTALPKDVARWWRLRSKMTIIEDQNGARIEGEGKERARLAFAFEKNGKLVFEVCAAQTGCLAQT